MALTSTNSRQQFTNISGSTLNYFWKASLKNKSDLFPALMHPFGTLCINVLVPYYIGRTFAQLANHPEAAGKYLLPLCVAALAGTLFNRFGFQHVTSLQARTMADLQADSLRVLLNRNVGFHNNRISGKLVSDALDYPAAYGQLMLAILVNILPFAAIIISGIIIVAFSSIIMALALVVIVFVILTWAYAESRTRANLRSVRLKATKDTTAHLSDTIVNSQTVKTFAKESYEFDRHMALNSNLRNLRIKDWQRAALSGSNRITALLAMQIGFIILTIYLVKQDPNLLGVSIFAFTYTMTLVTRLFEINNITRSIEEGLLQASPMTEIINKTPEIQDKLGAPSLQVTNGEISFETISFHYPDSSKKQAVFDKLQLTIPAGNKIGLIGPSGGGKSTLTRLLLRFEDIQAGAIRIDKQNITDVTQSSLHRAIGYVPQDPLLFHRSIRENIAYGKLDASNEEIEGAARRAYALDFITALPDGLNTIVGERGVKLSGGQRQRIAIARAILKDAPILVLDEATSALDSESEHYIQKALQELMQNRTTIVIAHRLSTIQKMDRIIVLDEGAIVEQGTHAELLRASGLYKRLWKHQSGGFIEE